MTDPQILEFAVGIGTGMIALAALLVAPALRAVTIAGFAVAIAYVLATRGVPGLTSLIASTAAMSQAHGSFVVGLGVAKVIAAVIWIATPGRNT